MSKIENLDAIANGADVLLTQSSKTGMKIYLKKDSIVLVKELDEPELFCLAEEITALLRANGHSIGEAGVYE